jgi:hypothetical protein
MQTIPLQPVPNQVTKVVLGGQNCQIRISMRGESLFVDVSANGEDVVSTVIAEDVAPIICRGYVGFSGNLLFIDTQGADAPQYTGLGTRWQLVYLDATEAEAL